MPLDWLEGDIGHIQYRAQLGLSLPEQAERRRADFGSECTAFLIAVRTIWRCIRNFEIYSGQGSYVMRIWECASL